MEKTVHILVFDGFADWEPSFALVELRRSGGLNVTNVGFTTQQAVSMGGLRVAPEIALSEVDPDNVRLFILPGADMWEEGAYSREELEELLHELEKKAIPIAGICGATIALAQAGLLDERAHTSNAKDYLVQLAKDYKGQDKYVDKLAVRDRMMITASGLGYLEFAKEIFAELDVLTPEKRDEWFHVFRTGEFTSID